MKRNFNALILFFLDRISEPSTWQAIFFIAGLCGSKYIAGLDVGSSAAVGGLLSAAIKAIFPDGFKFNFKSKLDRKK